MAADDPRDTTKLFETVREACSPAVWSRGVQLVRASAVSPEPSDPAELAVRVATRGGLVSPRVTLQVEDPDWECDCKSRDDPCEHVAAAVIAIRRAGGDATAPLRSDLGPGRIRYCLSREGESLALEREIVLGDRTHRLETTLHALASGRVDGPPFAASEADLDAELALGSRRRGPIRRETMDRVLAALARCSDVHLDGEPVAVSAEPVLPTAVVEDEPGGFRVQAVEDPDVRPFDNGAALCADSRTIRPLGATGLLGRELEDLRRGRHFPYDAAPELVSEVLPSLRQRIPVLVHTAKLPETLASAVPRVEVDVVARGDRLSALATLVYGEAGRAPSARVDAGRLVSLGGPLPVRDEPAERRAAAQLRRELQLAPGQRVELAGEEAVALAERLARWPGEVRGDTGAFARAAPLEPRLEVRGERIDLFFESAGTEEPAAGPRRVAGEAVVGAWERGESGISLPGGGFAALPADWLAQHGQRVADLLAARREDGELPPCAMPDLARLCEELDEPPPPSFSRVAPLLRGLEAIPPAELPADLEAQLRGYQRRGVDWLVFLRDAGLGALLADDMGLGKTLQALCALRGRCLVVAPRSVLHNWEQEARRFRPGLRVSVYHGPDRALDPEADLTLTTYAILRLDADRLCDVEWDAAVLDEAQAIKNPESQVARAAYRLRARFRAALTGTPVENRLEELWSQLHFLNRGLLGGLRRFQEQTARPIASGDAAAAARFRERIRPFILRRLKREVAPELPPRTEVVLRCELDEDERAVYDAVRAAARRDVVAQLADGGNVLAALEALLRLRQAACHSGLVPGQSAERSSKVDLLLERLEQAVEDGHKSLVFSQWTSLLDRVEPHLRQRQLDFARLDGSTRDRAGVVGHFQDEAGPPVLLISLKAGGTGLNLHAADHVFLLDPWWNPAVEAQAADRAHRIGQRRPVFVHRLVAEGTVEEGILELQQRKRALSEVALGEADRAASLSREELLALLSQ